MKATVYCRETAKGIHSFYLVVGQEEYFLFHQNYRCGVNNYYHSGVWIDDAMDFGKSRGDETIRNTMRKLPAYIRYAEKEYGVVVLDSTIKKQHSRSRSDYVA